MQRHCAAAQQQKNRSLERFFDGSKAVQRMKVFT